MSTESPFRLPHELRFCLAGKGDGMYWNPMAENIYSFHYRFDRLYLGESRLLPEDLFDFKLGHLREELEEYEEKHRAGDIEGSFDALIDLVYVAMGAALDHGFPWAEGWRRVHRANMQKERCLREGDSTRGSTYDIIKPEGWQPASLEDLCH